MTEFDLSQLTAEVGHICTVGLGREPRKGARIDQLVAIAKRLSDDPNLPRITLVEDAIRPSIGRLGRGEIALAARFELGTAAETRTLRTITKRREAICGALGIGLEALTSIEKQMHRAIAADLVARLETREDLVRSLVSRVDADPAPGEQPRGDVTDLTLIMGALLREAQMDRWQAEEEKS